MEGLGVKGTDTSENRIQKMDLVRFLSKQRHFNEKVLTISVINILFMNILTTTFYGPPFLSPNVSLKHLPTENILNMGE